MAALAAGLSVASSDESRTLVPELIELVAQARFAEPPPEVRPNWQKWLGLRWLSRRRAARAGLVADQALEALIRHWDRVPPDLVPLIASAGRGRFGVAADASTDPDASVRANVVAAAGELGEGALARLVGTMLTDQDPRVSAAAEHALVHMALAQFARTRTGEACLDPRLTDQLWRVREAAEFGFSGSSARFLPGASSLHPQGQASGSSTAPQSGDGIVDGIALACEAFERHRRRGVLLCAMMLLDRERLASASARAGAGGREPGADRLVSWFAHAATDAHSALRTVIRASALPVAGLRAMEWIGVEPWTRACRQRLAQGGNALEHELVLASAHLALRPRRARALSSIELKSRPALRAESPTTDAEPRSPGRRELEKGIFPEVSIVHSLSIDAARGAARIMGVVKAAAPERELAARAFLDHGDVVSRHAAMRALAGVGLRDWAFDLNPQVSAGAAIRLSRADNPRAAEADDADTQWWEHLARSPHERTRFLAQEELANRPDALGATLRGRLLAARRMARAPGEVLEAINAALTEGATQRPALMLARTLGVTPQFQGRIVELAQGDGDAKVVATAIAALADVPTPAASEAALAALDHADARVRANAVETLARKARLGEPLPAQVIEHKTDPHHRVRANCLRVGLAGPEVQAAAADLAAMLRDDRAEHRLAGAWLASRALGGRLRSTLPDAKQLAGRLVELASDDADPRVRRRAFVGASRVMRGLRAAWQHAGTGGER
ncbi:MAG: hypothetical protein GC200_11785 [Tepidisphaera sp.]|nr:hypothetical protein [Tepidisphaera sp.]